MSFRSILVALALVASTIFTGCADGLTSPTSPDSSVTTGSRNELVSARVAVMNDQGPITGGVARFGDTISLTVEKFQCENSSYFYGNQYVRDDGVIRKPTTGLPCAVGTSAARTELRDSLIKANDLYDFAKGHKVTIEFVIMDTFPNPVYRVPVDAVTIE